MSDSERFQEEVAAGIDRLTADDAFKAQSIAWLQESARRRYSYHFSWLGLPIIQYPQDLVAMQEIIWETRPDLIVETGIARGGSLIFYASMLELLGGEGRVLGIDVDIRPSNRQNLEQHPLFRRIDLLEGSSVDPSVVAHVRAAAARFERVLVVLDSNHTHDHVLAELRAYSPLVKPGNYLVVFDTVVEDLPADFYPDRAWAKGNNPRTAVQAFLACNDRFAADRRIDGKLGITVAPEGFLRCVKE